jgi:hypothetical protein
MTLMKLLITGCLLFVTTGVCDALTLNGPPPQYVTFEDHVMVSGKVSENALLFIQGSPVFIRPDQAFEYNIKVPTGDSTLFITTLDAKGAQNSLIRQIRRLSIPQIILETPDLNPYTVLLNTPIIPNLTRNKSGTQNVTRAEWAFIISQLHAPSNEAPTSIENSLEYAKNQHLIRPYLNNEIESQKPISELDYELGLLRANDITLNQNNLIRTSWTQAVNTALNRAKLLGADKTISPNALVSVARLYELLVDVPAVKTEIAALYTIATPNNTTIPAPIQSSINAYIDTLTNQRKHQFILESPQDNDIILDSAVTFRGISSPNSTVSINAYQISTDYYGNFQHTIDLALGRNEFELQSDTGRYHINVFSYEGHDDLKFHPFQNEAAELKFYDLLPQEAHFLPNKALTPSQAIEIAIPFIRITSPNISSQNTTSLIEELAKKNLNPLSSEIKKLDWVQTLSAQDDIIQYIEREKFNVKKNTRDTI